MPDFGLIGNPLTHSFSKKYFEEKFAKENLFGFSYDLFPLTSIDLLPDFLIKHDQLRGFNVTIPYKISILPFLDKLDPKARDTGAVNTVLISKNKDRKILTGYNTDVNGFEISLKSLIGSRRPDTLILGTGGASRAVEYVLKKLQVAYLFVSRNPVQKNEMAYQDIGQDILNRYTLIINTTPAGTFPLIENFPDIPYNYLTPAHILYDLTYNPAETRFIEKGKQRGCLTQNGLQMLHIQADESFKIWQQQS